MVEPKSLTTRAESKLSATTMTRASGVASSRAMSVAQATQTAQVPQPVPKRMHARQRLSWTGGIVGLIAAAYMLSLVALPRSVARTLVLDGPFVARLSRSDIQVNLAGESSKRYLVMALNAECFAYDESYVTERLGKPMSAGARNQNEANGEDPLYAARLKDAILKLASTRTRDQVTDPVQSEGFLEDIRAVVDPILFPVSVGDSRSPRTPDGESGVRVGESIGDAHFRGLLHEHTLALDAQHKTVALDDGPSLNWNGDERDLELANKDGQRVFVDLTQVRREFSGLVPIGVPGKVRRIYRESLLVQ